MGTGIKWCGNRNPSELPFAPEGIKMIYGYVQTLWHVEAFCSGREGDLKYLIRGLAMAKGMPETAGENEAQDSLPRFPDIGIHDV